MIEEPIKREFRVFEIMLLIVILGMTALFVLMGPHKALALNLFYVPIILSAFFMGRTSAGVLALFCALSVTAATTLMPLGFAAYSTPVMTGLALTVWAAVLGLAALLTGTLCDQRAATVRELHRAYVGVVEVLSKYLQGANPRVIAKSTRVAELSQLVAAELGLSQREVDDVRVAALLHDLGHVEITTSVISKAVDTLETQQDRHTFRGTELAQSLGSVLEGALPLLANQDDAVQDYLASEGKLTPGEVPLGARIIRAVRAYVDLANTGETHDAENALRQLRTYRANGYDDHIIAAIGRVIPKAGHRAAMQPVCP